MRCLECWSEIDGQVAVFTKSCHHVFCMIFVPIHLTAAMYAHRCALACLILTEPSFSISSSIVSR
ncbi:unnamed protein product [Chondrus crispus]|uniref:Uncharacterized protein n=1 Tax=Chondrus crispus TaxID=2769 RepID=R7QN51_CHOCR|nr:unnamed protein product [Chondrus crispus]CDF39499.1 unnamed protein product [Chondrus crispus]|eukprot:XP_005719410.1 unnamed protein product [Chondrus crispus]